MKNESHLSTSATNVSLLGTKKTSDVIVASEKSNYVPLLYYLRLFLKLQQLHGSIKITSALKIRTRDTAQKASTQMSQNNSFNARVN